MPIGRWKGPVISANWPIPAGLGSSGKPAGLKTQLVPVSPLQELLSSLYAARYPMKSAKSVGTGLGNVPKRYTGMFYTQHNHPAVWCTIFTLDP